MALAASLFSCYVTFYARGATLLRAAPVHTNGQLPPRARRGATQWRTIFYFSRAAYERAPQKSYSKSRP